MATLPVPFHGLTISEEKRQTKGGGRYFWQVVLKTIVGNVKCFMWNAPADAETNMAFPHVGDIIEVLEFDDQLAERGNVVIKHFNRITKDDLPEDEMKIVEPPRASDEELEAAIGMIRDDSFWDDAKNHEFVMEVLKEYDTNALKVCPAATSVHHRYQGGLLVHTAEVLELARCIVDCSIGRYSFINRDVLYAGAILHDIGKVNTYFINDLGIADQLPSEKTIGHIYFGMATVERVHMTKKMVSADFIHELMHCIASHHGLPEWGSVKPVQSIEAGILSRVDYISARNGMLEAELQEAIAAKIPLQDEFKVYGDPYFASEGMKRYVKEAV